MRFRIINPRKPLLPVRIAILAALTLLLSGWTTCSAMFTFNGCEGSAPMPQITSLSPGTIPASMESVLTVNGTGFTSQSQIMWNGTALPTTFTDSHHLQSTITQQTLDSFGAFPGSTAQISVNSPASTPVMGCPNGGASSSVVLIIN
jgi:hypothetical protein